MASGRDLGSFKQALEDLDLQEISRIVVEKTAPKISELNVDQLRHGLTSQETRLRPYRGAKYARVKHEMNPLPGLGNPDFILTGAFTGAIRTEVQGDTVGTHSYNEKAPELEARDGADKIYGLGSERHNEYVQETLQPEFIQEAKNALNG
jgi:hypothetical protein